VLFAIEEIKILYLAHFFEKFKELQWRLWEKLKAVFKLS